MEKDLIASLEALRAAKDLGQWASSEGIVHHFYLVPEDEGRSYIVDIGEEQGRMFVKHISV